VMMPWVLLQARSALGAQTLACFPAYGLERQLKDHCVPQCRFEVKRFSLNGVLLIHFVFGAALRGLLEHEKLLNVGRHFIINRIQTQATLAVYIHNGVAGN